jgi:hypothetical protein
MNARNGWGWGALVFVAAVIVTFPLFFAQSMGRSLSHDEHQHVSAGILVAKEGLLPYRDFPFFHTPNLPLVYGLFLGHCDQLLLSARLFSTICASLIAATLCLVAFQAFAAAGRWGLPLVAMVPLLLATCPVVVFTEGRASNHDLSILLTLLAVLCHLAAIRNSRRLAMLFLSGLLLALAMGTRVTFAPLVVPFLAAIFFCSSGRARLLQIGIFALGGVIGALPVLWLCWESPEKFFYGVLQFSQTNIDYRGATGTPQNMTLLTKLRFAFKEILVPNYAIFVAAVAPLIVFEWQRRRARLRFPKELAFLLSLLPFLLAGSFAPSPAFAQYFFAFAPFLLLPGIFCAARVTISSRMVTPVALACAVVLSTSALVAWPGYRNLDELSNSRKWTPVKRHLEARELRNYQVQRILTLAPIHVLEAGLQIDPAFVTGPFAWRVANYLPQPKRGAVGLIGSEDLEAHLAAHPVDAILVGHEQQWEPALIEYAKSHGYQPRIMGDEDEVLWVKPVIPGSGKKAPPAR